jgi:hypothetical protein
MSLGELQISFPLFFIPKIHQMTSYPETLTVKKLIKMRVFYYKDTLHFLLRITQILHIPKIKCRTLANIMLDMEFDHTSSVESRCDERNKVRTYIKNTLILHQVISKTSSLRILRK